MRLREWYSYHFPELVKLVPDNQAYVKCVMICQSRAELTEECVESLEEVLMDSAKAQAVYDASRSSMGMDITPLDLLNIMNFCNRVAKLMERRRLMLEYLQVQL